MQTIKGETFKIHDPELSEALFKVTYIGKNIYQ